MTKMTLVSRLGSMLRRQGKDWRLPTWVAGTVSGFARRRLDPVVVVPE